MLLQQALRSQASTRVLTLSNLTLTVRFDANEPEQASFLGIPPRALTVVGDGNQAKILVPRTVYDPEPVAVKDCNVYVYPIDELLLPPGAFSSLTAFSRTAP